MASGDGKPLGGDCHEGGALMNVSSVPKRGPRDIPNPSHHLRTQQEGAGYEPGRGSKPQHNQAGALILDFTTFNGVK